MPSGHMLPGIGNLDHLRLTGRHRGGMGDRAASWVCASRVKGDDDMPLTASRSGEDTSRHVATAQRPEVVVGTRSPTYANVDGLIPVLSAKARPTRPPIDIVEEWGTQSFPASDPPMNW